MVGGRDGCYRYNPNRIGYIGSSWNVLDSNQDPSRLVKYTTGVWGLFGAPTTYKRRGLNSETFMDLQSSESVYNISDVSSTLASNIKH